MFGAETGELLHRLVERRVSLLITGGTGSGKTTLLGALLAEVPANERIVLVEDVRELAVAHPHVVRLQGRAANVEGRGEVTLVHLVRQALRMRPDRLVVGEVRGAEVRELLAGLNTGHEGGCGTVHANSPGTWWPAWKPSGPSPGWGVPPSGLSSPAQSRLPSTCTGGRTAGGSSRSPFCATASTVRPSLRPWSARPGSAVRAGDSSADSCSSRRAGHEPSGRAGRPRRAGLSAPPGRRTHGSG